MRPSRALEWSLIALARTAAQRLRLRALSRAAAAPAQRRGRARRRGQVAAAAARERAVGDRQPQSRLQPHARQSAPGRARIARCCSPACRTTCARRWRGCGSASRSACATTANARGMVSDIEEMDKIIGQFLDFARERPRQRRSKRANSTTSSRRWSSAIANGGRDVRFAAGGLPPMPLRATAMSRLVAQSDRQRAALRQGAGRGRRPRSDGSSSCWTWRIAARAFPPIRSTG